MKFSIKRAGILVAVLAIVVLALAGCLCAVNVGNGGESNLNSYDTNFMTTADKEYLLEGSLDEMAEIWNAAMLESIQYNKHIKLTLMNDWVAKDGGSNVTMFGDGIGFTFGRIEVVTGAELTLDLNGFSIDRNVTNKNLTDDEKPNNAAIRISGTLNLVDSKYDIAEVNRVYEQYKNQAAETTNRVLLENLSKIKCGKITGSDSKSIGAAGIQVDGTLNMYGGMIIGNKTTKGHGGGIQANGAAAFTMYNGAIVGNSAVNGGGIYNYMAPVFNIKGGIIAENEALNGGGGYINSSTQVGISNCFISHNKALASGGGIFANGNHDLSISRSEFVGNYAKIYSSAMSVHWTKSISVYATNFLNNVSEQHSTIYLTTIKQIKLERVEITDNKTKQASNLGDMGGTAGLAIVNSFGQKQEMFAELNDVLISNNEVTDCTTAGNNVSVGGMVVTGMEQTIVNMKNVSIINNKTNGVSYTAGGFASTSNANIRIDENVVITGNSNDNGESNMLMYIPNNKLTIVGKLESLDKITHIGITFGGNYNPNTMPFTMGYSLKNNIADVNKYFYSDNTNKAMVAENGEVKLSTEMRPSQTALTWKYKANGGSDTTTHNITGDTIYLEYNSSGYTITNSANSVIKVGTTEILTQRTVTDKGRYAFTVANSQNYGTPILTVIINPKMVDVVWSNTELTYNGAVQMPTATTTDDNCTISAIEGGQINVGSGYVAKATATNSANYTINPTANSTTFSIKPANLTINITTKNHTKEYNGKVVKLPNDWYTLSATLLGLDKNMPLDVVFDIDHSAFIPQFNGADSATAVGDYTISIKPINAKDVFKNNLNYNVTINEIKGTLKITQPSVVRPTDNSGYDFILSENGRRVNYKDKDLIHGDNDSAISTYVLGNIAPNTSIQTFVKNLSFDITKITIYNRAGDVVYGESAISYYTDNINNGLEVAVGTGWRIEYKKLNSEESETIYLSVLGDLTGDGKVNSADVNYIRKLISDPTMYASLNDKPYIQLSALIINNGKLTNADGEILWNIVCGKMSIQDFI